MATWQIQDAEENFDAVIAAAKVSGAQILVREGIEEAAVVSIKEWKKLQSVKITLLEVLQSGPQGALNIPLRGVKHLREPVEFDEE